MRRTIAAAAALTLVEGSAPAFAAPCKDLKAGKFVKCPTATTKATRCKDAKGKFTNCGSPGAKPVS